MFGCSWVVTAGRSRPSFLTSPKRESRESSSVGTGVELKSEIGDLDTPYVKTTNFGGSTTIESMPVGLFDYVGYVEGLGKEGLVFDSLIRTPGRKIIQGVR